MMNEYQSPKRDSSLSKCSSIVTTIFFDLDNTLLATSKIDKSACKDVCSWLQQVHGVRPDASNRICSTFLQRYRQAPAPPGYEESGEEALSEWRRQLWQAILEPADLDHLTDGVFARWHACRLQRLQLTDEVQQLLVDLDRDYNIAIITNGPSAAQWEKIRACDLRRLVPAIVVSGDLRIRKPDKAIYFRTCDLLKVSPSECLMVGDKPETDILGAVNAGLAATVLVTSHQEATARSNTDTSAAIKPYQNHSHNGMCAEPSNRAETLDERSLPAESKKSSLNNSGHSVPAVANGCIATAVCITHNSIGNSETGLNAVCNSFCLPNGIADLGIGQTGPLLDNPKPADTKHAAAGLQLASTSATLLVQSHESCVGRAVPGAGKAAHGDIRESGDDVHCSGINGLGELLNGSSNVCTPCCGQASSSVLEPRPVGRLVPLADFVIGSVLDLPKILPLLNNNNRI